ncbi:hypothetical protein BJY00DRAFT_269524 [Aspergillus carlsbadensis]|nr:hypothetical protein BJY00DRAFT_269524 [Aspergillus carlsbadensis]
MCPRCCVPYPGLIPILQNGPSWPRKPDKPIAIFLPSAPTPANNGIRPRRSSARLTGEVRRRFSLSLLAIFFLARNLGESCGTQFPDQGVNHAGFQPGGFSRFFCLMRCVGRSQVAGRRSQVAGRRSQVAGCGSATPKQPMIPVRSVCWTDCCGYVTMDILHLGTYVRIHTYPNSPMTWIRWDQIS